jgi:hypothetical protein
MVAEVSGRMLPASLLMRRLTVENAPVEAVVDFDPRLGEQHRRPRVNRRGHGIVCQWRSLAISLACNADVPIGMGRPTSVTVTHDRPVTLVMAVAHRNHP